MLLDFFLFSTAMVSLTCIESARCSCNSSPTGLTAVVHVSLYIGVEVFVMHKFDLEKFCNITECHRVTYGAVVPPVVLQLGKSPIVDKYNLSSLRIISSGAAPLTKELMDLVKKRLNVSIVQGYGLSETSPVTHQQVGLSNEVHGPVR